MTVSVGAKSLKSASLGTREIKAIFLGGGRVWAKARFLTIYSIYSSGRNEFSEENIRAGEPSLVQSFGLGAVRFVTPVSASRSTFRITGDTQNPIPAGSTIPAGTYVRPDDWGVNTTFTEVV